MVTIEIFQFLVYLIICGPIGIIRTFNFKRLKYITQFVNSAWWNNTHIPPSQILLDNGIYGEFIATMATEQNLKANHLYGIIFNNVIIPKRDGDYNEIDILCIAETGIYVIEAKNWKGFFSGSFIGETWVQQVGHQQYTHINPVRQNLSHINYLAEYLVERLPNYNWIYDYQGQNCNIKNIIWNIILFCNHNINFNKMNRLPYPAKTFMYFAEDYKNSVTGFQSNKDNNTMQKFLTKGDVNIIANVFKENANYSPWQRQEMLQRRIVRQSQNAFFHKETYSVQEINISKIEYYPSGESNIYRVKTTICKDNGLYKTYLSSEDGLYRAEPGSTVLKNYGTYSTESEALNKYNEILLKENRKYN